MRLIYLDEAGTSAKEPVSVVASVIIDTDSQWLPLKEAMARIIKELVPAELQPNFWIHAKEIFNGGKTIPRDRWSFPDRLEFLSQIASLPLAHQVPIAFGIDFKEKQWGGGRLPNGITDIARWSHGMAFAKCIERSDYFLRQYCHGREFGVVLSEDHEKKKYLSLFGLLWRDHPFFFEEGYLLQDNLNKAMGAQPSLDSYKITNIIDVPHFVNKRDAPMLQLADVCAFVFRRYLSRQPQGEALLMAMLGPIQGAEFIEEPNWFSGGSSGLQNVEHLWSDARKHNQAMFRRMRAKQSRK